MLVSGHFGAGKSVFVQHYMGEYRGGGLAVVVFSRTRSPLDLTLIRGTMRSIGRKRDLVVDIQIDGAREEGRDWQTTFARAVRDAAHSGAFDRMVVELDPSQDPVEVARLAQAACAEASPSPAIAIAANGNGSASSSATAGAVSAPVACHYRIIDAPAFFFEVARVDPAALTTEVVARRPWLAFTEFQSQALRTADVVVLRATPDEQFTQQHVAACEQFIRLMQPAAHVLVRQSDSLAWEEFAFAGTSAVATALAAGPRDAAAHPAFPATESWLLTGRRPFHPERLADVLFAEWPELVRMKGMYWLATRPNIVAALSWAGPSFWSGMAGHWWSAIELKHWPIEGDERRRIDDVWEEPYGDRRQELVVVGAPRISGALMLALRNAMLTDEEMELGPDAWLQFPDPLPDITAEMDEEA